MRLSFPNNERDDVLIAAGDTAIGAAADNAIVLDKPGVADHHVSLGVHERSVVLNVLSPDARTHVNSRPVREKALLRLGDVVSLDTVQFVLKPDRDDSIRRTVPNVKQTPPPPTSDVDSNATRARAIPPKVVLRGVSGSYFGKIVPVRGRLVIGRGSECDLILDEPEMSRRHAVIENSDDGIFLRDLGSSNGTYVNGVQVRDAVLHPDDQIAFDRNRFLIEAPGMPKRKDVVEPAEKLDEPMITQTMQAIRVPLQQQAAAAAAAKAAAATADDRPRTDIWWLIAAAALIGIGIACLLFVKF